MYMFYSTSTTVPPHHAGALGTCGHCSAAALNEHGCHRTGVLNPCGRRHTGVLSPCGHCVGGPVHCQAVALCTRSLSHTDSASFIVTYGICGCFILPV